ncbi:hypothetical protein KW792_00395 [Candidatus Saccharibacteria bacterium]|nr:hypothetical protein [Candidatus Saccharibacteria bacterium]
MARTAEEYRSIIEPLAPKQCVCVGMRGFCGNFCKAAEAEQIEPEEAISLFTESVNPDCPGMVSAGFNANPCEDLKVCGDDRGHSYYGHLGNEVAKQGLGVLVEKDPMAPDIPLNLREKGLGSAACDAALRDSRPK